MKKLLLHISVVASLLSSCFITFAPLSADASVMVTPSAEAYSLLAATNAEREANGEADLQINGELTAAAEAKAADMIANNYWAHVSPSGKTPWDFIDQTGYSYIGAGENLAYGFTSLGDVMTGWMNSPTHRANVLKAAYSDVGFSIVTAPDFQGSGPQTIVVAEYGIPAEAAPSPAPAPAPTPPTPAPASLTPAPAVSPAPTTQPAQPATPNKTVAAKPVQHKITASPLGSNGFSLLAIGLTTPGLYLFRRRASTR